MKTLSKFVVSLVALVVLAPLVPTVLLMHAIA